ncbi:MAG: endolytic transglycosylase MltG [Chitinophagales bacterium]
MKKRIALIILAFVLIGLVLSAWKIAGPATAFNKEKYYLFIRTGMNFEELYVLLKADTVLRSPAVFKWLAARMDYPANIKAGRYEIRSGESLISIINKLEKGHQSPVNLIITKLRTKEDLAALVGRKLECDSAAFFHFLENDDSLSEYRLDSNSVMTAIFPNTYNYFWNTGPKRIFSKLFAEYKNFWSPERIKRAEDHGLSPKTAYIIASIVEEETTKQEDKGKMASVYMNRLEKNMKLAADPTVKFALRNFELKRIYDKYLQVESPYNTYKYSGLPPGPICTPTIVTIEAVLSAPKTNYLYFVAKPDFSGYSNFASDFKQHMINAKAYQKSLDEQMKIGAEARKAEIK